TVTLWLLRRAAARWPAAIRADLLKEWTAEVRTIERDPRLSALRRTTLMLGFGTSLALARAGGEAALGWKRVVGMVTAVLAYLLVLAVFDTAWTHTFSYMAE